MDADRLFLLHETKRYARVVPGTLRLKAQVHDYSLGSDPEMAR